MKASRQGQMIGGGLFALAALLVVGYMFLADGGEGDGSKDPIAGLISGGPVTEIAAFVGGEKMNFLANPEVQRILRRRHRVSLDARKAGSVEMMTDAQLLNQNPDLLWPSSQIAVELGAARGINGIQSENIFNAPIVIYSWTPIAEALVSQGIARQIGGPTSFAVDTARLLKLVTDRTSWADIGVSELFGQMLIFATDPNRSNSGNQFMALAAMIFAGGDASRAGSRAVIDQTAALFHRLGYMEHSSGTLFEQYLQTGMGNRPLVVGYESQLIEFANQFPDQWRQLEGRAIRPVILYPQPTVFSTHVAVAMTDRGRKAVAALADPELQDLAWRVHGFRSGFAATIDVASSPIRGVPEQVGQTVPSPPISVVESLQRRIAAGP